MPHSAASDPAVCLCTYKWDATPPRFIWVKYYRLCSTCIALFQNLDMYMWKIQIYALELEQTPVMF